MRRSLPDRPAWVSTQFAPKEQKKTWKEPILVSFRVSFVSFGNEIKFKTIFFNCQSLCFFRRWSHYLRKKKHVIKCQLKARNALVKDGLSEEEAVLAVEPPSKRPYQKKNPSYSCGVYGKVLTFHSYFLHSLNCIYCNAFLIDSGVKEKESSCFPLNDPHRGKAFSMSLLWQSSYNHSFF